MVEGVLNEQIWNSYGVSLAVSGTVTGKEARQNEQVKR